MICSIIIIAYGLYVFFELANLYKKKLWPDFWTNSVLCLISFSIAILLCFDVKIPSPEKPIREFITSIFGK